jgi:hypothetical protein
VRVAPSDPETAKQKARKLFAPMGLEAIGQSRSVQHLPVVQVLRQAAGDLLDGRTVPFDISIDISICGAAGVDLRMREFMFKHAASKAGIAVKHVRRRQVPFLSAFREPPAPYALTVGEGAAVACCPFFLFTDTEH